MKKLLKNKKIFILIAIILMVFVIAFITLYLKDDNSKKLKGEIFGFGKVAHESFADPFFYSCVVNAYNKENNTNYTYKDKLTNEQLASIKVLNCTGKPINVDIEEEALKKNNLIEENYGNDSMEYGSDYDEIIELLNNPPYPVYLIDGIELLTNVEEIVITQTESDVFFASEPDKKINLPDSLKKLAIGYYYYGGSRSHFFTGGKNLEELILSYSGPDGITSVFEDDLTSLKRIYSSGYKNYIDLNYEALTNLELLYAPDLDTISDFKNSVNLKYLEIKRLEKDEEKLEIYNNLEYLHLHSCYEINRCYLPKSMPNLRTLITSDTFSNENLPDMPKIKYLKVNSYKEGLDLSKYKDSLTNLYVNKDATGSFINPFEELNVKVLENLEYLYVWHNRLYIDGMENLKKLKSLYANYITEKNNNDNVKYSLENLSYSGYGNAGNNIYVENLDYNKFPNLKVLSTTVKDTNEFNKVINKLSNRRMDYLSISSNSDIIYDKNLTWPSTLDIKNFKTRSISNEILYKLSSVEVLSIYPLENEMQFDFSKFPNLKRLDISSYSYRTVQPININAANNLEYLYIGDISENSFLDFSKLTNLRYVELGGTVRGVLNFKQSANLEYLKLDEAYNLDVGNNPNLKLLLVESLYYGLDVSNSKKALIRIDAIETINGNILGSKLDIGNNIKLPKTYELTEVQLEDESLFEKKEDGYYSKAEGTSTAYSYYTRRLGTAWNVFYDTNQIDDDDIFRVPVITNILVFDVSSNNMEMNHSKGYILTNENKKEKDIINDVRASIMGPGMNFYTVVDRNNLKLYYSDINLKDYDLIKVTSSKYEIDRENIYYNGSFDASLVKATNAKTSLNENKLDIIYNNEVIKSYNLVQKDNLLGDVNGDGKISITDMTMQYKHVKYVLELDGDEEYRADLNSDEDVTITDVTSLYKILKGVGE